MVNPSNELRTERTDRLLPYGSNIADDPEAIRAQIQRTRNEMANTIDEIQRRLAPDYVLEQTQEALREAAVEKVEKMTQTAEHKINNWRTSAMQTVKDNPIPAAMVGIGLGWLLFSNGNDEDGHEYDYDDRAYYGRNRSSAQNFTGYTSGSNYQRYPYGPRAYQSREDDDGEAFDSISDTADAAGEWISDTAAQAQRRAGQMADNIQQQAGETATSLRENLSETMSEAEERAAMARVQARQTAAELDREARMQLRRTKRTFWETMEENPLAIGAAAVAIGALVGMVIPGTERENELMGDTRDRLVEEASTTAQETLRKAQNVAEQTAQTAVDETKREMHKAGKTAAGTSTSKASMGSQSASSQSNNKP